MNIKIGDSLKIHGYKHDGMIYKTWDKSVVLEVKKDCLVLANENVLVTKSDGRTWHTREPAIMFFYLNRWYNVIAQLKKTGLFYYCNIASPFVMDNRILKYIDYDLDLRVFPDNSFKILDRNEYNYHKKMYHYPKEINFIIKSELSSLIELKRKQEGPFEKNIVKHYFDLYKNICNNL